MTVEDKFREFLRGTLFPTKPVKDSKQAAVSFLRHKKATDFANKVKSK
jgi:hypothetical protein